MLSRCRLLLGGSLRLDDGDKVLVRQAVISSSLFLDDSQLGR